MGSQNELCSRAQAPFQSTELPFCMTQIIDVNVGNIYNEWELEVARVAWLYVLLAAIVEVFWVIGLRYSDSPWEWAGTVIMIVLSFVFIIKASERLPAGTVYAIFTGSGAAAIVLIDYFVFDSDLSWGQLFFIALIITGVIGIKLTSDDEQGASAESGTQ